MNAPISAPLVPAEVDLRDFPFMPLDVVRLRDSSLAIKASGEEFRAAVLLWCASWHQIPAGSLPDDDAELATFAGFGRVIKEFRKIKPGAMHGWVKCADGRLYHPVIAEKAHEAWIGKLRQAWRTECARIRKHNERHGTSVRHLEFDAWVSAGRPTGHPLPVTCDNPGSSQESPCENASKGQGEGQGQGLIKPSDPDGSLVAGSACAAPPPSEKLADCPQQEIIALFAEQLSALPQPVAWEGARADALRARWRWYLSDQRKKGRPHDRASGLDFFRRLFAYVEKSDFLMGRAGDWQCDLGWIVKAENFAKILQGNYENKESA